MSTVYKTRALLLLVSLLASCASTQDGSPSWSGNATHKKLSDTEFVVSSVTNAGSGPARLRPLLLARARELAAAGKYQGFVVFQPTLELQRHSDAHLATAVVRLTNKVPEHSDRYEHFLTEATQATPQVDADATNSASVVGTTNRGNGIHRATFTPWYMDARESSGGFWGARTLVIRPGRQLIGVHFVLCKSLLTGCMQGSLPLHASIQPGASYRVAGEIGATDIAVWIEDTRTGSRLVERSVPQ
jgi:hypothetical protein